VSDASELQHCELGHEAKPSDRDRAELASALVDLVSHMWVHDEYERNGFNQMTSEQRAIYEAVTECDDEDDDARVQWVIAAMKRGAK